MIRNFTKQDFYAMLTPNGDCLEWTAAKGHHGYGVTRIDGKAVKTHRLALELEGIDITDKHVLHSCDNPACCNPAHLRVGNHTENMHDMIERNRFTNIGKKGSANNSAIINEQDVIQIRHRLSIGHRNCDIATDFGVSRQLITNIKKGRAWSHIQ